MDYSAATEHLDFGWELSALPQLRVGGGVVFAADRRRLNPYIGFKGLVVFLAIGGEWVHDAILTAQCCRVAVDGEGIEVSGRVSHIQHSVTRAGQGSMRFAMVQQDVQTWILGHHNDCGFIEPVGRTDRKQDGQPAEALLCSGKVIRFTVR